MAGRHRQTRASSRGRHRKPPSRVERVLPALTAAAVLSVGGVGATAAFGGGENVHALARARPLPTVALPAAPVHPSISAALPSPTVAVSAAAPWFSVTTTGRVAWVQVADAHQHVLYAGLLRHGRSLSYGHRRLLVTIGDAGAVRVVVGQHPRDPAGRPGQVLRFTVR